MSAMPARNQSRKPQFSLRTAFVAVTIMSLLLGAAGFVRLAISRWEAERAELQAERAALQVEHDKIQAERAKLQAEFDRLKRIDDAEWTKFYNDFLAIKMKLGRDPRDQDELVQLLGRPMPVYHDDGVPKHVKYSFSNNSACFTFFGP